MSSPFVKLCRHVLAFVGLLLVWIGVAALMTLFVAALFPGHDDHNVFGDWRKYPGSVLGLLVGYRIYLRLTREPSRTEAKKRPRNLSNL